MEELKQKLIRKFTALFVTCTVAIPACTLGAVMLLEHFWSDYFALPQGEQAGKWITPAAVSVMVPVALLLLIFCGYLPLLRDLPAVRKGTFLAFEGKAVGQKPTYRVTGNAPMLFQNPATGEVYELEVGSFPKGSRCRICYLKHCKMTVIEKIPTSYMEEK